MVRGALGLYQILTFIGSGCMGQVWMTQDTCPGRKVTTKKVKEQRSETFR